MLVQECERVLAVDRVAAVEILDRGLISQPELGVEPSDLPRTVAIVATLSARRIRSSAEVYFPSTTNNVDSVFNIRYVYTRPSSIH